MTVTPSSSRLSRVLRRHAYRAFYRLPIPWRQRLVRLATPSFTVGALVLVRDADAPPPGRLLLLRQPSRRGWSMPGGLLDRGERPLDCAVRELAEETGIEVAADRLRPGVPNAIVHTHGRWVDMVFEVEVPAATGFRVDGVEVDEIAWYPLDDLPRLTRATATLLSHYGIGPAAAVPVED